MRRSSEMVTKRYPKRARDPRQVTKDGYDVSMITRRARGLRVNRAAFAAIALFLLAVTRIVQAQPRAPEIDVLLWFDTEDYLLPADDDAAKRLAELLSAREIRGTFKVVGEKARVLERRGRTDVIAALQKHAIGFHANYHSVHPTPTEYLADCGLL